MKWKQRALIVLAVILFFPVSVSAISYLGVETGLIFIFNSEEVSAPSPVILQGVGVTVPLMEEGGFLLETGILFYGTPYQYAGSRAAPADVERADTIWTLFTQLDIRAGYIFDLTSSLKAGGAVGLAFLLRFPLIPYDNGAQYQSQMFSYFFEYGRFILPEVQVFLKWAIVDNINLCFKIRAMITVANFWSPVAVPFWDHLFLEGLIAMEIAL